MRTTPAGGLDTGRWAELSPHLDQLLDVPLSQRAQALAALRQTDPALADELAELMDHLGQLDEAGFMQQPALGAAAAAAAEAANDGRGNNDGTGATPGRPSAATTGLVIGPYALVRELGQGGMGSVWLAERSDGRYQAQVAVKFLRTGRFDEGSTRRFAREGEILGRLDHPNIARLLDAGVTPGKPGDAGAALGFAGQPYLVLEYIDGRPIDQHCTALGLDLRTRVRLFMDVLAAVGHAHARLILHRDLKPSNILVTRDGRVKLLDFGIAKLLADSQSTTDPAPRTELTQLAGNAFTPLYAAPEQVQGNEVTTATDVYALGVLLFSLLTGQHPTSQATDTPLARLKSVVETDARRASEAVRRQGSDAAVRQARELRGDLDTIVARTLKKRPAERYANAAELADDLRRWLHHEPVRARPDGGAYRLGKFVRRNRLAVGAGTAVVLALAVGGVLALIKADEALRARALAEQQRLQAEGLVEFMLGDLRSKLEPVGRLDALAGVGSRALAYYESQDTRRLDDAALGRRARSLRLLAELADLRGQTSEAMQSITEARRTSERLAMAPGASEAVLVEHGKVLGQQALIVEHEGRIAEAERLYREAVQWHDRAVAVAPRSDVARTAAANARADLGIFHIDNGRAREALPLLTEAHETLVDTAQRDPTVWKSVVNVRACIADVHHGLGDYLASLRAMRTQIDALRRVPGADRDRQAQGNRALGLNRMAGSLLNLGHPTLARDTAQEAVDIDDTLIALEPTNVDLQGQTIYHLITLAEGHRGSGNLRAAREHLARAVAMLPKLMSSDRSRSAWQFEVRARVLTAQAVIGPAPPTLAADLADLVATIGRDHPPGTAWNRNESLNAAEAGLRLGDLLAAAGRTAQARAHWQVAADRVADGAVPGDVGLNVVHAQLQQRLGHRDQALAMVRHIEGTRYRRADLADLRARLGLPALAPIPLDD